MLELYKVFICASLAGTCTYVLFKIIRPITQKIFSASWHYYIWLIVLFIMLIPIRINMTYDIFHSPLIFSESDTLYEIQAVENKSAVSYEDTTAQVINTDSSSKTLSYFDMSFFSILWLIGAVIALCKKIIFYVLFVNRIKNKSKLMNLTQTALFTERNIKVWQCNSITSPMMIGIFKPVLILPEVELSSSQLEYVLRHEFQHLKRLDIPYKWLVCIVKSIHWFNPFVYFLSNDIATDCEISCDLKVVNKMNEKEINEYVSTILFFLSHGISKQNYLSTGIISKKQILKRRFIMIKKHKMHSKKSKVISIIIALLLLISAVLTAGAFSSNQDSDVSLPLDDVTSSDPVLTVGKVSSVIQPEKAKYVWPLDSRDVTNTFGFKDTLYGERIFHNGIDISASEGEKVRASFSGIVTKIGYDPQDGNYLVITGENGEKATYSHLSEILISIDNKVEYNDLIGSVGKTGAVTGPALHFSIIIDGSYQDPLSLLE